MKEESKSWLMQAEADFRTAENSLKSKDYYASVFWSQQSIEKCLKAVIIHKEGELVKIHDLVILGRRIPLPSDLSGKIKSVSGAYIETRYGIIGDEIPSKKFKENDALEFIKIAREVLEWVKKMFK